jgi:hypothetical protein
MAQTLRRVDKQTPGYVFMSRFGLTFMGADPVLAGVLAQDESAVTGMLSDTLARFLREHEVPAEPGVVFDYAIEGPFKAVENVGAIGTVSIWFKPKS